MSFALLFKLTLEMENTDSLTLRLRNDIEYTNAGRSLSSRICFTPQPINAFPQIVGGLNGATSFNCLDYNSAQNLVVAGGYSSSPDTVSTSGGIPILIAYDSTSGNIKWANQLISTATVIPTKLDYCSTNA